MDDTDPGRGAAILGTLVAVVGVLVALFALRDGGGGAFPFGALMVVAGLLLRIEGAIRGRRTPGP